MVTGLMMSARNARLRLASLVSTSCTVWPGEYPQLNVPHQYDIADQLALEPRGDNKHKAGPQDKAGATR